jgi:hypothetical protein
MGLTRVHSVGGSSIETTLRKEGKDPLWGRIKMQKMSNSLSASVSAQYAK